MKKAVFLDRDGVINKAIVKNGLPTPPSLLDELKILPGVKESILKLKKLNFVCIVVTNQPDVSRGKINKNAVIKINNFFPNCVQNYPFLLASKPFERGKRELSNGFRADFLASILRKIWTNQIKVPFCNFLTCI